MTHSFPTRRSSDLPARCDRMTAMVAKTLNLDQFLPYRLSIASNALSERIAEEYQSRFGLTIPEWRLMAVLGEGQPKTQPELVAASRVDKVPVNRAAKALTDRHLFARESHATNRSSHHTEPTHTRNTPRPR